MLNWLKKKTLNSSGVVANISNLYSLGVKGKNDVSSTALQQVKQKALPLGQAKHSTPASQEWINSVYSFNKTFTKTLPATDNVVNRLIKSYFTLTTLFKGKKSKRVQIRFRRLSLNRILVSKAEIKHTNNKVIITVYLYNKNKKFLFHKLKNLYQTFLLRLPYLKALNNTNQSSFSSGASKPASRALNVKAKQKALPLNTNNVKKSNLLQNRKTKLNRGFGFKVISGKVRDLPLSNKLSKLDANLNNYVANKKFATKRKASLSAAKKPKFLFNSKTNDFGVKIYNYINSIKLTNKRLSLFFVKLRNTNLKNKYKTLMKNYYSVFNKYKLYSPNNAYHSLSNQRYFLNYAKISGLALNEGVENKNFSLYTSQFYNMLKGNLSGDLSSTTALATKRNPRKSRLAFVFKKVKPKKSIKNLMHKVRNFYKLFILQDMYIFRYNTVSQNNTDVSLRKNNLEKNLYKLINQANMSKSKKRINSISLKAVNIIKKARKRKNFIISLLKWNNETFTNYEYKYYHNFIKKAYKKEVLYMYYVKMLSINNNKFKNWFLLGLKKVVSRLYNKKVEFNFVNLKYLHLNSDIFSESIATKLRNRENRLLTVLKKALTLVKLSSLKANPRGFTNISANSGTRLSLNINTDNPNFLFNSKTNDILHDSLQSQSLLFNTQTTDIKAKPLKKINIVLDCIKHKAVFGVRLEAAGRLSKRLTASRSVFKLKYKGSIKNIDSSKKNLSSVILRGNIRPNIQYTKISNKTRNGSFGLKGWVSGY